MDESSIKRSAHESKFTKIASVLTFNGGGSHSPSRMPKIKRQRPRPRPRRSGDELSRLKKAVVRQDIVASTTPFTSEECSRRWDLDSSKKRLWSPAEDRVLVDAVQLLGIHVGWSAISDLVPGRTPKRCRERWVNHLTPGIRRDQWSSEEDQILVDAQRKLGNTWTTITELLPGRTANNIKNRWYSHFYPKEKTACSSTPPPVFPKKPPPVPPKKPPSFPRKKPELHPPAVLLEEPRPSTPPVSRKKPAFPPLAVLLEEPHPSTPPVSQKKPELPPTAVLFEEPLPRRVCDDFLDSCLDFSSFPKFRF